MSSLLGHLYTRIKGSPEDVATLSLCYILENSEFARKGFSSFLSRIIGIDNFPELRFRTQVIGQNKERPDMAGYDDNNNELILIESKFWAGLTENQPLGYLKRLKENESTSKKVLVFICPENRKISLWGELLRICKLNYSNLEEETMQFTILVDGIYMTIVSWRTVTDLLMQILSSEHSILVGDLQQLQGLCEEMDDQAFIPFKPEDFGVDNARRIISYYNIVDKVADVLKIKMGATSKGLKATPQFAGYSRYLIINNYGISVQFNCRHWGDIAETPFWLTLKEIDRGTNSWIYPKDAHKKLGYFEYTIPRKLYLYDEHQALLIPLYTSPYKCEDDVIQELYEDIKYIFKQLGEVSEGS